MERGFEKLRTTQRKEREENREQRVRQTDGKGKENGQKVKGQERGKEERPGNPKRTSFTRCVASRTAGGTNDSSLALSE